jgi:hypothetical protein
VAASRLAGSAGFRTRGMSSPPTGRMECFQLGCPLASPDSMYMLRRGNSTSALRLQGQSRAGHISSCQAKAASRAHWLACCMPHACCQAWRCGARRSKQGPSAPLQAHLQDAGSPQAHSKHRLAP